MGGMDPHADDDRAPNRSTPAPLPVMPVDYASAGMAVARQRPGSLVTIGVLSIVFGAVGALAHLVSAVFLVPLAPQASVASPAPPRPLRVVPAPANLPPPYRGDLFAPSGLPRAARERALAAVERRLTNLSPDRGVMLRQLLGECGRDIFGSGAGDATREQLAAAILQAETLAAGPDGVGPYGTAAFHTAGGAVLIDDALARFFPDVSPGSASPASPAASVIVRGACVVDAQDRPLRVTSVAVAQDLEDLRVELGGALTPVMAAVLARDVLPGERAIRRKLNMFNGGQQTYALSLDIRRVGEGTLEVREGDHTTWVMPNGALIRNPRSGLDPRTGLRRENVTVAAPTPATPGPPVRAAPTLPPGLFWTSCTEMIAGTALAVFLVYCGVITFTDSPHGGQAHARWAHLKLASIALFTVPSAAASLHLASENPSMFAGGSPALAGAMWDYTLIGIVIGVVLQLAYPVVVLRVLRSRAIGAYYAERGGEVAALSVAQRAGVRLWIDGLFRSRAGRGGVVLVMAGLLGCAAVMYFVSGEDEPWWATSTGRTVLNVLVLLAVTACAVGLLRTAGAGATLLVLLSVVGAALMRGDAARAQQQTAGGGRAGYQDVKRALQKVTPVAGAPDPAADAQLRAWAKAGEAQLFILLRETDGSLSQAAAAYLGENLSGVIPRDAQRELVRSTPEVRKLAKPPFPTTELQQRAQIGAIALLIMQDVTRTEAIAMLNDPDSRVAKAAALAFVRAPWGAWNDQRRASLAAAVVQRKQSLKKQNAAPEQMEPLLRIEQRLRDEPAPVRKQPVSPSVRQEVKPVLATSSPVAPKPPRPPLPEPQLPPALKAHADAIEPLRRTLAEGRRLDESEIRQAIDLASRLPHGQEHIAALLLWQLSPGEDPPRRAAASWVMGLLPRRGIEQLAARAVVGSEAERAWPRTLLAAAAAPLREATTAWSGPERDRYNRTLGKPYGYGRLIALTLFRQAIAAGGIESVDERVFSRQLDPREEYAPQGMHLREQLLAMQSGSRRAGAVPTAADFERRWTFTADWSHAPGEADAGPLAGSVAESSPAWGTLAACLAVLLAVPVLGAAWLVKLAEKVPRPAAA